MEPRATDAHRGESCVDESSVDLAIQLCDLRDVSPPAVRRSEEIAGRVEAANRPILDADSEGDFDASNENILTNLEIAAVLDCQPPAKLRYRSGRPTASV